jgi:hypothetical protein
MGAPPRKSDMDQNSRCANLQGSDLAEVRQILGADGRLNDVEVARRSWSACEIADKSIFDEDARQLASAFRCERVDFFYVVRVCDLLTTSRSAMAYRFEATQDGIEEFQSPFWFEINLDDCLIFNLPVTCAVLRPGDVDTTRFVGPTAFIEKIKKL